MTRMERRDPNATYNKLTVAQLDALSPGFSYQPYFAALGTSDTRTRIVGQPNSLPDRRQLLKTAPLADWKTYLRWHLINSTAALSERKFCGRELCVQRHGPERRRPEPAALEAGLAGNRRRRSARVWGSFMSPQAFPPAAKARALTLVQNVKAALRTRLQSLDWIGEDTRRQALVKLDKMRIKIGYPDHFRDYSKLASQTARRMSSMFWRPINSTSTEISPSSASP